VEIQKLLAAAQPERYRYPTEKASAIEWLRRTPSFVERTANSETAPLEDMGINHGGFHILMAQ
jgi:hypothetical protein